MAHPARPPVALAVDAVLFDMDGTLVDSTAVVDAVWAEFAERFRLALPEVLAHAHGQRTPDTVRRFLPGGDVARVARVAAELQATEVARVEGIVEIPGARRLLDALDGARVAVVTSASRELAVVRLVAAGLPVPGVLVCAEDVTAGKPDPAGYLRAAGLLGVAAERCAVFEDAEAGIRAGIGSGARTVVVGAHRSPTTEGLPRVTDLREVEASVGQGATVRLRLPGPEVPDAAG